jgi:hypothetical protein
MTLEAFARAHKLPPCWLELREACEEIVKLPDFWYRPDLQQQSSDLAVRASNILESALTQKVCAKLDRADALSPTPLK